MRDYRIYIRCSEDGIEFAINIIFHKCGLKREAYLGGHINCMCVRRLMADSEDIINEILFC